MAKIGFTQDLGVDLGTANTLVYVKGKGIVLREPSVVAIKVANGEVEAVGNEAKMMLGRTPRSISVIRPMKDGVIADYETTAMMMKYYMHKANKKRSFFGRKPNVMVCVPSGITMVEERAVLDATKQAGAKDAFTIGEPFAAAIGAGLPVWEPTGSMVVDIGGGTTEVAVLSLGGMVTSKSIRIAGDKMDDDIIQYIRKKYHLLIGQHSAEIIKMEIGTAEVMDEIEEIEIRGRDLISGLPNTITITNEEIAEALHDTVQAIVEAVKSTLENTPPELAADVMEKGIMLAGGGSMLKNLAKKISQETKMPALVAENALDCVAIGTGKALDFIHHFRSQPTVAHRSNH